MAEGHKLTMLGTGLIGMFYTIALHRHRGIDRVQVVYSRTEERARTFAEEWDIPRWTTDLKTAIEDEETDGVVIGLPNDLHLEAATLAAQAGKAVLCTKPLGRTADEAQQILNAVEEAGVFGGYLEDLVYPPKNLKSPRIREKWRIGPHLVGAIARNTPRSPQRLVLGHRQSRWRRDCRYGMSLHRNYSQLHRQRHTPGRSDVLVRHTRTSSRSRGPWNWTDQI